METPSTTLQNLPLEMLDMILMKTVAKIVLSTWEDSAYKIRTDPYKHLATVWSAWHNRLTTRWFRIVLQRKLKRISPLTKYKEKPELVKEVDIGHGVWGLAMLDKELFVASIETVDLFVYDPVTFTRLRVIHLEGVSRIRDIAACQQKKCLVLVANMSLVCVDRKGTILKEWQVPYYPHNISVMPSGNILLNCNTDPLIPRLLIYSSDGNIIQDLGLDADAFKMSWQTILLRSGNYLVCQGWDSIHHRVLKVSPEGTILKSFGSERGPSGSHLSAPVHMTMDRDELIFVADSDNNRVVLLSRGLVFLKELLSEKDGVNLPYRVLLDETSGLLYVGTGFAQILIFNIYK